MAKRDVDVDKAFKRRQGHFDLFGTLFTTFDNMLKL